MNKKISFRHAPVVETVIGVQFEPLGKMTNAHLGAFWKTLGPEWPNVTDAPRIEDQFERFDAPTFFGGLQLKLTQNLSARLRAEQPKPRSRPTETSAKNRPKPSEPAPAENPD